MGHSDLITKKPPDLEPQSPLLPNGVSPSADLTQQLLAGLDSGRRAPAPRRPVFPLRRSYVAGPVRCRRRPSGARQSAADPSPGPGSECQHLCSPPRGLTVRSVRRPGQSPRRRWVLLGLRAKVAESRPLAGRGSHALRAGREGRPRRADS